MVYRSSITTRLTYLRKRFHPSFSHITHQTEEESHQPIRPPTKHFPTSASSGFNTLFRRNNNTAFFAYPLGHLGFGSSSFCNYSSSAASTITDASEKIEFVGGVADVVLTETGGGGVVDLAAQAPVAASEVAIAAADSFYNVAALQYLIDGVHSFTGFNWWASIALTTLLIRGATVPLLINQLKASTKLAALRPQLEEIKQQMENRAMDPNAVSEGQRRMKALFKEHGVTPFTPLKGLLIQGPVFISFFLAINNMVEKVPSFKGGGVFWFTDLTTPDSMYILPVLTSLTFLITVEFNMQEGMEGNPAAGTMKKFSRILAFLTIPFTMSFPKAIFCYWVTSNFFSLMYGLVIRRPQVRKLLALPELPQAPTTTTTTTAQQPAFNLLSAFKGLYPNTKEGSPLPSEQPKISDRKISSSSIISQRIRNLEKQVKGKKKNKRR